MRYSLDMWIIFHFVELKWKWISIPITLWVFFNNSLRATHVLTTTEEMIYGSSQKIIINLLIEYHFIEIIHIAQCCRQDKIIIAPVYAGLELYFWFAIDLIWQPILVLFTLPQPLCSVGFFIPISEFAKNWKMC